MRLALKVRGNEALSIAENPLGRTFPAIEFKVASVDRYFENVQYHIADNAKSNIYPWDSWVTLQGKLTGSFVGYMIVEKEHRLYDAACEFSVNGK